ncbi:hypothetical protein L210DRAFT_2234242 [Boletus edulis BED1]|uniref:Uncharacterized protein n=1 Tax=Boletus edulis BED1 TaxID=1328754 RepID=A0AAD4BSQ6_BOLED|nr:hypothetical protein L210DRAFT_2234242 [Boletus edulis BED1]
MFGPELARIINAVLLAATQPQVELEMLEDTQISALVSRAATMQQDIEDAADRCTCFERSLATLQSESDILLTQDAAPAMDTLLVLVNSVESLHQVTQDQRTSALLTSRDPTSAFAAVQVRAPLVTACKSQSRIVFAHFQSLSEKARNLTQKFSELATDFTFEISLAQERIERLQNMVQLAKTLRNGVESERESWHGQKATAEEHIQQARETIRSAERKRDSAESARVVRNIFTLGLGEVFDFFDLNEEIENAERRVASAEQNAHACKQSIQRAVAALQRINGEVARLNSLGDTVYAQETTLQASVTHGQALRTRTIDLTNASLDVSLFVGTLAARSETLAVHHTAQEFAQGVLNFGRLMASDGRLNGLLVQHDPGVLQETLDMIAQSEPVNDVADLGHFVGAQQPRLAIHDLM